MHICQGQALTDGGGFLTVTGHDFALICCISCPKNLHHVQFTKLLMNNMQWFVDEAIASFTA